MVGYGFDLALDPAFFGFGSAPDLDGTLVEGFGGVWDEEGLVAEELGAEAVAVWAGSEVGVE